MSQHCAWMLDRAKDFQIQPNLEFPGAAQTCTGGVQPGFQNGAPTSSLSCSAAPWIQRSLCHDIVQISGKTGTGEGFSLRYKKLLGTIR